jgi:uncharacterized protein YlxW (UPF0749 family)
LIPRSVGSQALIGLLCAVLGFALVVQVSQTHGDDLAALRQSDLVRLFSEVNAKSQDLADQVQAQEAIREELQSGATSNQAALALAQQQEQDQGILSGRLSTQGAGIEVFIDIPQPGTDPAGGPTPSPTGGSGPVRTQGATSALQAFSLFFLLEELRNAGAEAIQVNDVRLVTTSYFTGVGEHIEADGQPLTMPLTFIAIGNPQDLQTALEIPAGAKQLLESDGAHVTIQQFDMVSVTATITPATPRYMTPAPTQSPS